MRFAAAVGSPAAVGLATLVALAALAALAAGCGGTRMAATPVRPATPPPPADPVLGIEEASGITRVGDTLIVVGDHEPGTFYRLPLRPQDFPAAGATGAIPLAPERLERIRWPDADSRSDLESVHRLADGRLVLLSEDTAAVCAESGPVVSYGPAMQEISGRGLEGLAVRALPGGVSRVAVLWEGGYPDGSSAAAAFPPAVLVLDVPAGTTGRILAPEEAMLRTELDVPRPPGEEPGAQRFRAPDLVWYRFPNTGADAARGHPAGGSGAAYGNPADDGVWGFLVLLSSGWGRQPEPGSAAECDETVDGTPRRYCHKWIQRFTAAGEPFGEPWDIEPQLPEGVRLANVEGMSWFQPGRSVVLVYDEKVARRAVDPQVAVVLPLPAGW